MTDLTPRRTGPVTAIPLDVVARPGDPAYTATVTDVPRHVCPTPPPPPTLLAYLRRGTVALTASVAGVALYTFGVITGSDAVASHNGTAYIDPIQRTLQDEGWYATLRSFGAASLLLLALVVGHFFARRHYAQEATR